MKGLIKKVKKFWKILGPGLITGASDDDPSGIVTYSIAGAKLGLSILWTSLITLPFMIVIQKMSGRIGLISRKGLTNNIKKYYHPIILFGITFMTVTANIFNIGADIYGITAAFHILLPLPHQFSFFIYSIIITSLLVIAIILIPYHRLASYMKWVVTVMFSYVAATFFIEKSWIEIIKNTIIPHIKLSKDYLLILVAVWGTTISPYLFFWQSSEEAEEEKTHINPKLKTIVSHSVRPAEKTRRREIGIMNKDIKTGMFFSNLIMYFIIVMSSYTLFKKGVDDIQDIIQIAKVLEPLAGYYANFLFLIGITAAGTLAIPVLISSTAYIIAEAFGWKQGLEDKFTKAKQFYIVLIASAVLGLFISFLGVNPVEALFLTAIIHGIIAPFLIFIIIHMTNNPKIVGRFTNTRKSNILGYILLVIMSLSAISLIFIH